MVLLVTGFEERNRFSFFTALSVSGHHMSAALPSAPPILTAQSSTSTAHPSSAAVTTIDTKLVDALQRDSKSRTAADFTIIRDKMKATAGNILDELTKADTTAATAVVTATAKSVDRCGILCSITRYEVRPKDSFVYSQGASLDTFYLILSGEVSCWM